MPYVVEAYDNFDHPNERSCSKVGEYDTADAAIAAAKYVIDKSLRGLRKDGQPATEWYRVWASAGDGIYILGDPPTGFSPYDYARAQIEELTGEKAKDWLER